MNCSPLPGPLDAIPGTQLAEARAMLDTALAGLELGAYDRRIVDWLVGWDAPTIATVASLLDRAATLGAARALLLDDPADPRARQIARGDSSVTP